jgi:hypothetical protein
MVAMYESSLWMVEHRFDPAAMVLQCNVLIRQTFDIRIVARFGGHHAQNLGLRLAEHKFDSSASILQHTALTRPAMI